MNALDLISPYKWLLYGGLALALFFGGRILVERYDQGQRDIGRSEVQARWDKDTEQRQALAIDEGRQAAAETLRRLNKQQENQHAQDSLLAGIRRDRDAAVAAADRLQLRAAAYLDAAGCSSLAGDPALECVRTAAAAIGDALGRSAAIARQVASDADEARVRGLKCEADYDALTVQHD